MSVGRISRRESVGFRVIEVFMMNPTYKNKNANMEMTKFQIMRQKIERLEEEKKGVEKMANLVVLDIENLIKEALPSGIPSILQIGKHMGMSRRTVARKLSEYGLSYRELVRKIQEAQWQQLLKKYSLKRE